MSDRAKEPGGNMGVREKVGVIGLGYVGLPVALAFARKFPGTVGFDIHREKVDELRRGHDRNQEHSVDTLRSTTLQMTSSADDLRHCTLFVVAVPTPVDENNVPDLTPVERASETVGRVLAKGSVVVYESTVYPGVTEDVCGPILARASGLKQGVDFKLGYSPERINPGDKEHTLEKITKVVSGEDAETLERVASAYGAIVDAGVHRAPSIKVAEAAKVIENTQRDLNIALMNELAIIFDRIGHPDSRRPRRGGHQVELPQVSARPGRRTLHRRRPVLPDDEGAAARLPAGGHPGRTAHQQQRRPVRRAAPRPAPHRGRHHRQERPRRRPGPHVQGGLQRHPEQQSAGHSPRAP